MKTSHLRRTSFLVLTFYIGSTLTGCVSVNIGPKPGEKARDIQFQAPPAPFVEKDSHDADRSWQSKKNGNSISFQSVCNEASDPSLQAMQRSTLASLGDYEIKTEKLFLFNGREALDTMASGKVDGVPVSLRFLVFKRNNCNYTVSYISVEKSFQQDLPTFEHFVGSFKVP